VFPDTWVSGELVIQRLKSECMLIVDCNVQGAAEKSGPLNVFAVFSATFWDFNMKFYIFI